MPAAGKPGNKQNVPARWVHLTYCYRRVVIERLGLDFTQLEDSSVKSLASQFDKRAFFAYSIKG